MRRILLIGIGAGDSDQVTVQAIKALNTVDVVFLNDKGDDTAELVRIRRDVCERYLTDRAYRFVETPDPGRDPAAPSYRAGVAAWHRQRVERYEALIQAELADGECGAFLVWGDPSLYDSTLRIVDEIRARGVVVFEVEVIPGISSIQVLAAKHRVPINQIGGAVCITTGRQLRAGGLPDAGSVVVVLDGTAAFTTVDDDVEIFWGANLGTDREALVAGPLRDVSDEILAARDRVKASAGWVLDTYLLRRGAPPG